MINIDSPTTTTLAEEPIQDSASVFNIANAVDDLRQLIARADAFASAADDLFERVGDDRRLRERLAHLVTAAAGAVRAVAEAGDRLAAELIKHREGV